MSSTRNKSASQTNGFSNEGFVVDEGIVHHGNDATSGHVLATTDEVRVGQRQQWGHDREFLLSCIAMSVGLGNVWRFPFTAFENGGGAFLIPYIITLILVGKPFYLLEMILGQFSSQSTVKIWEISPAFRGVGIVQLLILLAVSSYYCSLMALTLFYLVASFQSELPWGRCREEWGPRCVDSQPGEGVPKLLNNSGHANLSYSSSAELYFYKVVLREKDSIDDGIGMPDWRLTIGLFVSWLTVFVVVIRGVRSSGKAAYFLAIFPYIVLVILLVRAVSLEGALSGILYLVTPNWEKLWDSNVWYNAVAQCFFSLTICFGAVVMFASHNKFDHNVYSDAMIVTTLDTFTSILAGCTIFGILGHLSHQLGVDDISKVARGGTGLAFISYPETIVKFTVFPQFFGVLFFVMIYVLGIGSEVGLASSIISIVHDQLPGLKHWQIALGTCVFEFFVGLIYVTPGGQYMVTFVDYYATSFIAFIPAACEVFVIAWVYGLNNFLQDVEFMLNRRLSMFWKVCWAVVTPTIIIVIFVYTIINLQLLKYNNVLYPDVAYIIGWVIFFFAVLQIPFWMAITMLRNRKQHFTETIKNAFRPSRHWGPMNPGIRRKWLEFKEHRRKDDEKSTKNGTL